MSPRVPTPSPQLCQLLPQFPHTVGVRPARSASRPTGKKQMETMIAQLGNAPCRVRVLHFGQDTCAIEPSSKKTYEPRNQQRHEQTAIVQS